MSVENNIISFLRVSEKIKNELRHSWLSSGRQESVADHTWQMALLGMLIADHLDVKVNTGHVLEMVIVHDLVEAIAGDIPFMEVSERSKRKKEAENAAIAEISEALKGSTGEKIAALWYEFEEGETAEARFARALDNLEVQIQHNIASLTTWESKEFDLVYTKMDKHCAHDSFLRSFCEAVKSDAEDQMRAFGTDPEDVKKRIIHK